MSNQSQKHSNHHGSVSHSNHHGSVSHVDHQAASTTMVNTLTNADTSALLFMIEEEKMARDVYDALYAQTGLIQFDKISNAEQNHYDTLLQTAQKLGVDTSSLSTEAGVFSNIEIQTLYDTLLAQAQAGTDAAIAVGIAIEKTDIADLYAAMDNTEVAMLDTVYAKLLGGSESHLAAFENIA